MSTRLETAVAAARHAGAHQRDRFGTVDDYSYKSPGDPVSEVDRESERRILDHITDAFPDDAVLSEECGRVGGGTGDSTHTWVVDPLDGTTNYLRGDPDFAVSIAVERAGTPHTGVIYRPASETLFAARRRGDAVTVAADSATLEVSDTDSLDSALVAIPYASARAARDAVWSAHRTFGTRAEGLRSSGAGALDLARLAVGRLDAVVGFDQNPWDCAAGHLLAECAGATVTDLAGAPEYDGTFVATNGQLHAAVLDALGAD